jgi:hypothetical protein
MNKKIFLFVLLLISFLSIQNTVFWNCNYDPLTNSTMISSLENCINWTTLVNSWDAKIDWWFWSYIKTWTNNIALYIWILAVFAIVFGSLKLTLSTWDDEKINKAKAIVKWWIIWFLGVIFASSIINLVIRLVYSL